MIRSRDKQYEPKEGFWRGVYQYVSENEPDLLKPDNESILPLSCNIEIIGPMLKQKVTQILIKVR
jgi:hypothetical protein